MNDDIIGSDVHQALDRLTDGEPSLGFSAAGLIAAGRRRRRRHTLAVGGTSLAAVAIIAGAVAVPAAMWAPGSRTVPAGQVGSSVASLQPTPAAPAPWSGVRPQRGPDASGQTQMPGKSPSCPVATDQQWNDHLAFEAQLRAVLPQVSGEWASDVDRNMRMCAGEWPFGVWTISSSAGKRSLQASVSGADPKLQPDEYRKWQQKSPCDGYPSQGDTCTFTRHGQALVFLTHQRSPGGYEEITVLTVRPDNSGAMLTMSSGSQPPPRMSDGSNVPGTPQEGSGPPLLSEQELIDAALQLHV